MQQLIELGYVEDPKKNGANAIKSTVDENNYNLARAYINGQKWQEGIEILEKLHTENPTILRFALRLTHAYQTIGKLKDARGIVDHIRSIIDRESPQLDILEGSLLLGEERNKKALELFKKVEREAGKQPTLHLRIAKAYLQLNRLEDAESAILKELEINSEEATAHYILGQIYFQKMQYNDALNAFFDAVGLLYYYPPAHFYIGESLQALEKYEEALKAYDICLKLVPNMNLARQRIISIYENQLGQPGKARKYKTSFEQKIKGTINIVSGLPRSGTSMMMQMLEAGGLEIFTDNKREADDNNPKGYYELEAVKSLKRDSSFLAKANGKTLKVIAQLLQNLPMNYRYRIVFMERNIIEIVASQQKMLERNGKTKQTDTLPLNLLKKYEATLKKVKQWVSTQPNIEICFIKYSEVQQAPFLKAMLVNDFFDGTLNVEKMAKKVDASLHREKSIGK